MMIRTKYQGSMPSGPRQVDWFMFSYIHAFAIHVAHAWGHFRPKGHYLNKLGRGPIDDATY